MAAPTSVPGWYPDPVDRGLLRWWDGQRWSPHTTAAPKGRAARARLTGHQGSAQRGRSVGFGVLLAVLGLGGLLVAGGLRAPVIEAVPEAFVTIPVPRPPVPTEAETTSTPTPTPTLSPTESATPTPSATPTEAVTPTPVVTTREVVLKYKTITRKDSSLARGKRKVIRAGRNGLRIDTYEDDQKVASEVVTKPLSKIVAVGTKAPPPVYVYYENCAAARAAGAAPVYRGEPGYGRHLDRDGDGIGCE